MNTREKKIEAYLSQLERALGQIPVGDRSEIILEIKSHIVDSQTRNPDKNLSHIFDDLGKPHTVAKKYLLERGIQPLKEKKKTPFIKWLTIGFLGTFAILALTFVILLWKFTPLVSIDDSGLSLLGGAISLNSASTYSNSSTSFQGFKNGSFHFDSKGTHHDKGSFSREENQPKKVKILLTNAKTQVTWSDTNEISWDCKSYGERTQEAIKEDQEALTLSLLKARTCKVTIPKNLETYVSGVNGKIHMDQPQNNYEVDLSSGVVRITPDPSLKYHYDLAITHGSIDKFKSYEKSKEVLSAKVSLGNGKIRSR